MLEKTLKFAPPSYRRDGHQMVCWTQWTTYAAEENKSPL